MKTKKVKMGPKREKRKQIRGKKQKRNDRKEPNKKKRNTFSRHFSMKSTKRGDHLSGYVKPNYADIKNRFVFLLIFFSEPFRLCFPFSSNLPKPPIVCETSVFFSAWQIWPIGYLLEYLIPIVLFPFSFCPFFCLFFLFLTFFFEEIMHKTCSGVNWAKGGSHCAHSIQKTEKKRLGNRNEGLGFLEFFVISFVFHFSSFFWFVWIF